MPFVTSLMIHVGFIAVVLLLFQVVRFTPKPFVYVDDFGPGGDFTVPTPPPIDPFPPNQPLTPMPLPGDLPTANPRPSGRYDLPGDANDVAPLVRVLVSKPGGDPNTVPLIPCGPREQTIFTPPKSRSRSVCLVCDASGSMLSRFDELRGEIVKTVNRFEKGQFFNVIFFQESSQIALSSRDLLPATAENKARCFDFVQRVSAHRQTNPIPAMELALKQHPQTIFLLTDGDFDDNEAVVKWIHDHNTAGTTISTIAFLTGDASPREVLTKIANQNHGRFTQVEEK